MKKFIFESFESNGSTAESMDLNEWKSEAEMKWKRSLKRFDVAIEELFHGMVDNYQPKNKTKLKKIYKAHIELR